MIQHEAAESEAVWDPERAYRKYNEHFNHRYNAREIRLTAEKMPDSKMVRDGVKVPGPDGQKVTISVEEYALSLDLDAERAKLDFWRAGGIMAVQAYIHGRQGVSYAGEVPTPHRNTHVFTGDHSGFRI